MLYCTVWTILLFDLHHTSWNVSYKDLQVKSITQGLFYTKVSVFSLKSTPLLCDQARQKQSSQVEPFSASTCALYRVTALYGTSNWNLLSSYTLTQASPNG